MDDDTLPFSVPSGDLAEEPVVGEPVAEETAVGAPVAEGAVAPAFQSASTAQGQVFAGQCDFLLSHHGFTLRSERLVLNEVGVEVDRVAESPSGATYWFEYKGSIQGNRPGLRRTDTVKKAVANGALLRAVPDAAPYIVLTSHVPDRGAGAAMLRAALELGYVDDVICIYDPEAVARLRAL